MTLLLTTEPTWSRTGGFSSPGGRFLVLVAHVGQGGRDAMRVTIAGMDAPPLIDVSECDPARLTGTLLAVLRELSPGQSVRIASRENPEWALRSIDLHLQHRLQWRCAVDRESGWTTTVDCSLDQRYGDLIGLLLRDHRCMDALFARALAALNAGDVESATRLFGAAAMALRRHIALEDELLAPELLRVGSGNAAAVEAMQSEHAEILAHLRAIEESLAGEPTDGGEAAILGGMLCGLIAKHEHREESTLFPLWQVALARLGQNTREALFAAAFARLGAAG